jgi:hypothetical protein
MVFRERINELEKETIVQSKENYILNCELDYETVKATQLQAKNDNIMSGVNVNKMAETKERE